jgi:hypothetical protein
MYNGFGGVIFMEKEFEKKSNFVGLAVMFVVLLAVGVVLNFIYIVFMDNVPYIMLAFFATLGYGGVLAGIVFFARKWFVIRNKIPVIILVVIAFFILYFVQWNMFIALWYARWETGYMLRAVLDFPDYMDWFYWLITYDLSNPIGELISDIRFVNFYGTWGLSEDANITGAPLTIVWIVEFLIMLGLPIIAAVTEPGVYLEEENVYADPTLLNYAFEEFDEYELSRIAEGDIEPITEKTFATAPEINPFNVVAICYVKKEPTDYIAIYTGIVDKKTQGLLRQKHITTARLSYEKIEKIKSALEEKSTQEIQAQDIQTSGE